MKTCIVRIITSIEELAQEAQDLFQGGRPDAQQAEYFFTKNNTPAQAGYIRIRITENTAHLMEQMLASGYVSPNAEVVRIEHYGQDRVQVGEEIEERLFEVGTDEGGNPVYLGRIS